MAGVIRVSVDEMSAAATCITQLEQDCNDICQRFKAVNDQLQGGYEGQSAAAFDAFVCGTIVPVLTECAAMCGQTSQAIQHTCSQFTDADATLSTTFS